MKFETFQAGVLRQRYQYKSFEPVLVNHEWVWEDATINTLLEAANRALGELNAFSLIVPDIDLFIAEKLGSETNGTTLRSHKQKQHCRGAACCA